MKLSHLILFVVIISVAHAATKRCYCKAIDSHHGVPLMDFGAIASYGNKWIWIRCKKTLDCPNRCHARVQAWACENEGQCQAMARGNTIRYHYSVSGCGSGSSHSTLSCGC